MATQAELHPLDDVQPDTEKSANSLRQDVPDTESAKRKASINEDEGSPKRIKHDDHFREATSERPRRGSTQNRRDSYGGSPGVDVDRRKLATQEEKKRGKRLFGGLLSTLSQTAGNTQQKRRLEIERRQQERLQKQRVEDDKLREEKRARVTAVRKGEQIGFDEEVMRNKHSKMIAMAQYLRTRSHPQIYYLPWKLTEAQEDEIDGQIRYAKVTIECEVEAFNKRREQHTNQGRRSPVPEEATAPLKEESAHDSKDTNGSQHSSRVQEKEHHHAHHHHHDESADVLEEAEEDMVIY
ncbi:hypothetical protein FSARC_11254 [Fusarium sarcochroum]|uniref:Pinin/SDK/MemA protein domain-containing protein n=1 Tax=Fusarium sarcochroum TaxID=1208366 RepID=A0A8H4TGI1_9HYPO|nr:hypothetical protein FSARC_11254 [Fusarium sarcochroum]